jgi:hypothetical protein
MVLIRLRLLGSYKHTLFPWSGNPSAPEKFFDMSYFEKVKRHTMP